MKTLFAKLWRRPALARHLTFTVYTRAGCHCCDKALHLLTEYRRRHGFSLEEVDVDGDPDLRARYDTEVPVVAVNGKVRFRGIVNPVLLDRLILAESRDRSTRIAARVTR
jgi:glutaredoxin